MKVYTNKWKEWKNPTVVEIGHYFVLIYNPNNNDWVELRPEVWIDFLFTDPTRKMKGNGPII